jgi:hypothetical protein
MKVKVKKGNGFGGYTPAKVKEERVIQAEEGWMNKLLHAYGLMYTRYVPNQKENFVRKPSYRLLSKYAIDDVLTNSQLNQFLIASQIHSHEPRYPLTTGLFMSKLVQNMYYAGERSIEITPPGQFSNFPRFLAVDEYEPLCLELRGEQLNYIGYQAENCNIICYGNVDAVGQEARNCAFYVEGNVKGVGVRAEESDFHVKGGALEVGRFARNSNFTITGDVGIIGENAEDCSFRLNSSIPDDEHFKNAKRCRLITGNDKSRGRWQWVDGVDIVWEENET